MSFETAGPRSCRSYVPPIPNRINLSPRAMPSLVVLVTRSDQGCCGRRCGGTNLFLVVGCLCVYVDASACVGGWVDRRIDVWVGVCEFVCFCGLVYVFCKRPRVCQVFACGAIVWCVVCVSWCVCVCVPLSFETSYLQSRWKLFG